MNNVQAEAAEWLVELQSEDLSVERIAAWQQWLAADERHRRVFEEVERTWNAVDQLPTVAWPRAEELALDGYNGDEPVAQWLARGRSDARAHDTASSDLASAAGSGPANTAHSTAGSGPANTADGGPPNTARNTADSGPANTVGGGPPNTERNVAGSGLASGLRKLSAAPPRAATALSPNAASPGHTVSHAPQIGTLSPLALRRRVPLWVAGAAAAIVLAVGAQLARQSDGSSSASLIAETRVGERRTLQLADGSAVSIGGHSAVEVALSAQSRDVTLTSGEAFFQVAKDASRPFIVHAGQAEVRAVGTAFNVKLAADTAVVSVAEGAVQVADTRLAPGQQIVVDRRGTLKERQSVDAGAVGGWRTGRLQYVNEPLATVVADVRRYSMRDVEIADDSVAALRMTGTVFEDNVEGWLGTLERALPVTVQREADGKIILRSASRTD